MAGKQISIYKSKGGKRMAEKKNREEPLIKILHTDRVFTDSPDEGWPECICSRCGKQIKEGEVAIRAWPESGKLEWRYHPACLGFQSCDETDI